MTDQLEDTSTPSELPPLYHPVRLGDLGDLYRDFQTSQNLSTDPSIGIIPGLQNNQTFAEFVLGKENELGQRLSVKAGYQVAGKGIIPGIIVPQVPNVPLAKAFGLPHIPGQYSKEIIYAEIAYTNSQGVETILEVPIVSDPTVTLRNSDWVVVSPALVNQIGEAPSFEIRRIFTPADQMDTDPYFGKYPPQSSKS